jgi:integrase
VGATEACKNAIAVKVAELQAGFKSSATYTWADAMEKWAAGVSGAPNTVSQVLTSAGQVIDVIGPARLTSQTTAGEIKDALDTLASTPWHKEGTKYYAQGTLEHQTTAIKQIVALCDWDAKLRPGVFARVSGMKPPKALGKGRPTPTMSLEEVHQLVDHARTIVRDDYIASYVILACLDLGPRPDETRPLTWADISNGVLSITKGDRTSNDTKTERHRMGTITAMSNWALAEWRSAQQARGIDVSDTALIWPGPKGRVLTVQRVSTDFGLLAKAAGLPLRADGTSKYTQESTRHSYIAMLTKRLGVSTDVVSNLAGHFVNGSITATTYGVTVDPWILTEGKIALDGEFPVA